MSLLRCYIITPDTDTARRLSHYIGHTPMLECAGVFTSPHEAFSGIVAGHADIVFAQDAMPQLGGLELARLLPPRCRMVLLAHTAGNAAEAYDSGAVDYLRSPVSYERFTICAARLLSMGLPYSPAGSAPSDRSIFVKSDYKLIQLPLDEILFIEGLKDYVKFYMVQDQRSVMSLMSMKALESYLAADNFMRVHRSYIVNLRHVRVIDRGRIVFGPHYIPVGESYKASLQHFVNTRSVSDLPSPADEIPD